MGTEVVVESMPGEEMDIVRTDTIRIPDKSPRKDCGLADESNKTPGQQFCATRAAHRVSESPLLKSKIKEDIELPELSGSEGSRLLNAEMENVLQNNVKQMTKRISLMEQPKDITELVVPRRKLVFLTVPPNILIKWSPVNPISFIIIISHLLLEGSEEPSIEYSSEFQQRCATMFSR